MLVVLFDFLSYELPGQVFGSFFCSIFLHWFSENRQKVFKETRSPSKSETNKDEHKLDGMSHLWKSMQKMTT